MMIPGRLSPRLLLALLGMMALVAGLATAVAVDAFDRQRDRLQAHRLGPAMAGLWQAAEGAIAEGGSADGILATRHVTDLHFEIGAVPEGGAMMRFLFTPSWDGRAPFEARLFLPHPLLEGRSIDLGPAGDTFGPALGEISEEVAGTGLKARLALPLSDGRWLSFASPRFWQNRWTPVARGLAVLAAGAGMSILAFMLARLLALPVERLAESVAREPAGPPLPLAVSAGASEEVAQIAAAIDRSRAALAELLEDRTRMLAAISHDLRTPATRLKLRAEWIEDDGIREKILADLDEMTVMIAAALDYLKQGSVQEEAQMVAFTSLLQAVCDDYRDLGRPVRLTEAPPLQFDAIGTIFGPSGSGTARAPLTFEQARSLRLRCRPDALRRALTNLIDNALKYGGVAEVMVQATSEEVIVDVLDEGPGIPEEEQSNVLRPFYRLEQSRNRGTGGTGLGLAIVKSVIDAHGGTLELSNRARTGLRARMVLPRRL